MVLQTRRGRRRGIVIAVVVAVIFLAASSARFYTDVLWFGEVGLSSVLWKSIGTQFAVGITVGLAVALLVWGNLVLAARLAPAYRIPRFEVVGRVDPLDRYRETIGPYLRWLRVAVAVALGFLMGAGASGAWQTFLLWANRASFNAADPQFGRDVGFYVFELPFLDRLLSWAWVALILSLIVTLVAHYFHGSIRPEAGLAGVQSAALAHISVILGLLALVKAGQYWLGQYELNFSPRGVVTGASYTDVHAQLPALRLLVIISIISAVLFLVNIRVRTLRLPLAAVGIWILFAVAAGGVWPWAVQNFSVRPQEPQREGPFIQRNLTATRAAFGLDDDKVQTIPFAASEDLTAEDIAANQTLLQNVRLWDPALLQQALHQLQALRTYYEFQDVDIDRYEIAGETRQVLLSPRELSTGDLESKSQTWSNLHLQFTHGYGIVASLANAATPAGTPDFIVKNVPGTVTPGAESLDAQEKKIYFGEAFDSGEYSVVNSEQEEIDYPTSTGVQRSRYAGEGGIPVGGFLRRLAFALREGDPNLVLSGLITGNSKILIYKNVRDRVLRAAPFLSLDNDPYMAVVDGRLVWIIDAYTSTPYYPYSQRFEMSGLVDTFTPGALHGTTNYVRNSVKIVVDAYDGTMQFHIVDPNDPLIEAWSKAFPALFTDAPPSDGLRAHFRYPEDLFKVQSEVYRTYHMKDPTIFYAKEDAWGIPANPVLTATDLATSGDLPPTYLLTQLPGDSDEQFLLTRPFTPRNRPNMISFMTATSDPENYGELRILQFPRQQVVLGPIQVDNLINQDVEISRNLTLLSRGGSRVDFGRLVILPIEDSILYVQPLFVTAENVGNPELKRVIVVHANETIMGTTFEEALAELFGAQQPVAPQEPQEPGAPGDQPRAGGANAQLQRLLAQAGRVYDQAQRALADGDFETYGRLIERLGALLERAEGLSQ